MRIRLLHSYSGTLTNEHRMAEGEHDVTEALGQYLIANGHAVAIDTVAAPLDDIAPLPHQVSAMASNEQTSKPVADDSLPSEPKSKRRS